VTPRSNLDAEEVFHDQWARSTCPSSVQVDATFEAPTAPENRYILRWLGDVQGLSLLDLGTGCGEAAVYFAKRGASVTAVDLSSEMLRLVQEVAREHGVTVATAQMSATRLALRNDYFDVVYASNLLHHVDKEKCLDEVRRVLKPGGACCVLGPSQTQPDN